MLIQTTMSQQLHIDTDAGWQMTCAIGFFFAELFVAVALALAAESLINPQNANEKIALISFFLAIVSSLLSTAFTISNLFCSKKTEKAIFEKLETIKKQTEQNHA